MNPAGLGLALAMLFGAPVGAGLTGADLRWGIAFSAIYLGYMAFFRQSALPSVKQILGGAGMGRFIPLLVVQLVLGLALTLLGLQLRAWFGIEQSWPIWPWIALCCAGVLVGRAALGPWAQVDLEEADRLLGDMEDRLSLLETTAAEVEEAQTKAANLPDLTPATTACLTALDALPGKGTPRLKIDRALAHVPDTDLPGLLAHLDHRARENRETDLRALTLAAARLPDHLSDAFEAIFAAADVPALKEALALAEDWVALAEAEEIPENASPLPPPARFTEIADQIEDTLPDLADRMITLANRIENLDADNDG